MSSIATFFRTLPDTLQQPAALAMLGSLGAHLLVFATLPAFTSSNEPRPEAEVRRVRLVEPSQGSPGAQIARSQAGLPPVPNTPNSKIQLPIAGSGNSPVPNPLYTIPDLAPVPVPDTPPPRLSIQQQIAVQQRIAELRRIAERDRLVQQQAQANNPPKPPQPKPPEFTGQTAPLPNLNPQNPSDIATRTLPSPGETQSAPLPNSSSTTQPRPDLRAELREKQTAMSYNPDGVFQSSNDTAPFTKFIQSAAQRNINVDWSRDYIRVRQLQDPKLEKPMPEVPYPLQVALPNFKQNPIAVAIFVGKDGKPLPNMKPELIGSTGYQILNDKAIEIIQQQSNQPNQYPAIDEDRIRVFVYEFQFKAPEQKPVS